MRSDMSVTVTRDNPVTSRVTGTCDRRDMSRVSHATTTTPHHTMFLFGRSCLSSGQSRIRSNGSSGDFGFGATR